VALLPPSGANLMVSGMLSENFTGRKLRNGRPA